MTRSNRSAHPNEYTVDLAEQLYQMWHEKSPRKQVEEVMDFPTKVFKVGVATHILYESDKWEKDGKFINYIHKFTSLPNLFAENGMVLPADVEPISQAKTAKMMGVPQMEGSYGFPVLARVLALRWSDGHKARKITFKSYKPVMSCSVNQKTVVIFADEILLIHGGSMVVAAPGIMD